MNPLAVYRSWLHKRARKGLFVMDSRGFINTTEGWRLYGKCLKKGDLEPYYNAKLNWQKEHIQVIE